MKIKELYTDESKWTHGANARDTNGAPVLTHSQRACNLYTPPFLNMNLI